MPLQRKSYFRRSNGRFDRTTTTLSIVSLVCWVLLLYIPKETPVVTAQNITGPSNVQVGDEICFEGYVMDYFCIERGTLLDNPSVRTLEGPDKHSVHCLVDVEACYTSPFEILADPTTDDALYTRAYQVDDNGRTILIDLARSHGDCSTCTGSSESESTPIIDQGFRAEVYGTVVTLSSTNNDVFVPVQIKVLNASRSNDQATICGITNTNQSPDNDKEKEGDETEDDSGNEKGNNDNSSSKETVNVILSVIAVVAVVSLTIVSLYYGFVGRTDTTATSSLPTK